MTVSFHTLGCKLNQCESESLASSFRQNGFSVRSGLNSADIHIVNTCTVTSRSDQKARKIIRNLAKIDKNSLVLATGCYAQVESETVSSLGANVIVVPQSRKSSIYNLPEILYRHSNITAEELRNRLAEVPSDAFKFPVEEYSFHTRAFLKIQDGCDHCCTYCRVPAARGPSRSLGFEEAIEAAVRLENTGYREIVLTGVNITAFEGGLPALVAGMLTATKRVRIRLSSLEPESIDRQLTELVAHKRICPHFHIPVQSGSDRILAKMKRRYRIEDVVAGIDGLRQKRRNPFIAADAIVGFPGEEEGDFRETIELFQNMKFSRVHVFSFSRRPGTAADDMKGQIDDRTIKNRMQRLAALSVNLAAQYRESWVGKEVDVLVEDEALPAGTSQNYLKVVIQKPPKSGLSKGELIRCRIVGSGDHCHADFVGRM